MSAVRTSLPSILLVAASLLASLALAAPATALPAPLPRAWPHALQLGLADPPGDAAHLRTEAPFGFRYQYLSGGVNTGHGWATWAPDGSFARAYVRESKAHGVLPVFSYYMLLQSSPSGGNEAQTVLAHLRNTQLMDAYWKDVRLLFQRVRGDGPVIVHVEPDLWGYLEQADQLTLARSFARQWRRLRNELAPNVVLAYHLSTWGTKHDIVGEKPSDAAVRAYAARAAAFYHSLDTHFDVAFEDFSDRDADFYKIVDGNPNTWFTPADFRRELVFGSTFMKLAGVRLAVWQIPLGNTHLDDTWGHFRDNRVQWFLGPGGRPHLQAYVDAGYVGLLFGGGADGTTSAQTDGGYFFARAFNYYSQGLIPLP